MRFGGPFRDGADRAGGAQARAAAFRGGRSDGRRRGGAGVSARQGRAQDEGTRMSAGLRPATRFEPMTEADLRAVLEIEEAIYAFSWTPRNFRDSPPARYRCWG